LKLRLALLCAFALAPLSLWSLSPLVSTAAAPRTLSQVQSQIQSKQRQIESKKGSEKVLTSTITGYSQRIADLQSKISTLQGRQASAQADLDAKRAELSTVQTALRDERARLTRLRARLIVARDALEARLVELYKSDRPDLITVVLSSKGFADLLERSEFLRRISDSDKRIVATVRDAKAQATATTTRLAALEQRQQAVAATIMQRRDQIVSVKGQLVDTRSGYEQTRASKRAVLSTVRTQREDRRRRQLDAPRRPDPAGQRRPDLAGQRPDHVPVLRVARLGVLPSGHRHRRSVGHPDPGRGVRARRVDAVRGVVGRLRQLHLRPAHGVDVDVLRPPVLVRHLDGRDGLPGRRHRVLRLHRPLLRRPPPLRGAHQRRGHQPAELPLIRGRVP
jgi:peptidoglycan hydrolase CwlO-like protein